MDVNKKRSHSERSDAMEVCKKQFKKRQAILDFLQNTTAHPSAEMVFNHLKPEIPDLSLGTVYRNLSMFKEQGKIISLGTVNGVERFDGNTKPHVHFICTGCSDVADLPEVRVPAELNRQVAGATGGRVDSCQLTFTGECSKCLAKNPVSTTA